jgi:hypothetical protein
MIALVIPITFLAISLPLIEPLNLIKSFVIVVSTLILFLISGIRINKQTLKTPAAMIMLLVVGYFISGFINNQTFGSQLMGGYNRNQGNLVWISFALIFMLISENKCSSKQLILFGLNPLLILAVVYGYIQVFKLDPIVWGESSVVLTLGNSNFAAPLLVFLGIYCLSRILENNGKYNLLFYCFFGVSTLVLGFQTNTLQYPVLAAVSIIIFLFLYKKNIQGIKLHITNFMLTFTAICLLLVAILKWEIIYIAGNAVDRLDSMRAGYQIWLNQPIFGVGIEQLYMFSPEFRTQRQFEAYGSSVVVDKAHNVFIDHLSNGGIFVFLAFIGYVFWILTIIFKMNKRPMSAMQRNKFTFLCTVWLIWLGQASIGPDNNLLTLLSIFAAGLISQTYYSEKEIAISATKKVHLRSQIVGSSVTSSLLLVSVFAYSNSILSYREAKLVTENKITDVTQIEKVINRSPIPKLTEIVLVHLIKNQKNCPYMYSFIEDFKEQNPRSSQAYYFSAICKSFDRKDESALKDISLGLKYDPLNINLMIADFRLRYTLNDIDGSQAVIRKILALDPKNNVLDGYPDFVVAKDVG